MRVLQLRGASVVVAAVLAAAVMLAWATAPAKAAGPVVTCASPADVFNTGYNAANGKVLPAGAFDANWQVAGPFAKTNPATKTGLPPANAIWAAPVVGNQAPLNWSASPFGNAQWIAQPGTGTNNGDWYYRFRFTLDSTVSAALFSLQMSFLADNDVAEVFVNGVAQSPKTTGLPQDAASPYSYVGYQLAHAAATTLNHDWQTGQNEIIVQMKSNGPAEGFLAQIRPSAVCPVDLAVSKSATPAVYDAGQPLTYTVSVTNKGPGLASGVNVADPLPAALNGGGFTWQCTATAASSCLASGSGDVADPGATLAPGGTLTYTFTGTVPLLTTGAISNTATVTPGSGTVDAGCTPSCSATLVTQPAAPVVSIKKTATVTPPLDQAAVRVGDTIAYTYKVTNVGNVALASAAVSDPDLGAVTCPPIAPAGLAPGAAVTCTANVPHLVTQADVDAGHVTDTATATGKDAAGLASPTSPLDSVVVPAAPARPSTHLDKVADAAGGNTSQITVGETVAYRFLVTNDGNVTLKTVTVHDPDLGHVTCPALPSPGLAPGDSVTCTADNPHTVTQSDVDAGSVIDTATAGGTDPGGSPIPVSPPASVQVRSDPQPRVAIDKAGSVTPSADQGALKITDTIAYSYVVTNIGNTTLASVSVSDPTIGAVTCPVPASPGLAPGRSITCGADLPHVVTQADVDAGNVTDTATARGRDTGGRLSPPSDPSTVTLPALPAPAVTIAKTATVTPSAHQAAVELGDHIAYAYTVKNTGNVTLARVAVSDPADGAVTCPTPPSPGLAPGASLTCNADATHVVRQAEVDAGEVVDVATAQGTDTSGHESAPSPPAKVRVPAAAPAPAVSLTKAATVSPAGHQAAAEVGDVVAYRYAVKNTGNVTLASVTVDDPGLGPVTCPALPPPGLAPGETADCAADVTHVVTQAEVDAGHVTDTATATGTDTQANSSPPSSPATAVVPAVAPDPGLTIHKAAHASLGNQASLVVGETISYSYSVANTGNVTVTAIAVDDPTGGSVTCPTATLAPGESENCAADAVHTVDQSDVNAGTVVDTATATGQGPDGNPVPPSAPDSVSVPGTASPEVAIDKLATVTPAADQNGVKLADTISYSYVVTNIGNVALASVAVDDPSLGTVTCATPAAPGLAPGDSVTCTADATYGVTQADVDAGGVRDTATASGVDTHGNSSPTSAPSSVVVPSQRSPKLGLLKSAAVTPAAHQAEAERGDTIAYSYVVTNLGNVTLATVDVHDPSLGHVGCAPVGAGLAPGASISCTADVSHTVTQQDVDTGHVDDTATATGLDTGGVPATPGTSTVTVPTAAAVPEVAVVKHADVTPAAHQNVVEPGDTVSYSYTVTNTGNVTLASVTVHDPTIGGVDCPKPSGGLAPGASLTCAATPAQNVTQADVDRAGVADTATAEGVDTAGRTAPLSDPSRIAIPADAQPSVSLQKTAVVTPSAHQAGAIVDDTIDYSFEVTNTSKVDLSKVTVDDPTLGGVRCPLPAAPGLAPGASLTCTGQVTHLVTPADLSAGKVANSATATGTSPTGITSAPSNTSSATVPVGLPQVDLSIVKTADRTTVTPPDTITYTLKVVNQGPDTATGVVVDDAPAAGLVLLTAKADQGTCSVAGNTAHCPLGRLAAGASATVTVTARVDSATADGTKVDNVATVDSAQPDAHSADNRSAVAVTVTKPSTPPGPPSPPPPAGPPSGAVPSGGSVLAQQLLLRCSGRALVLTDVRQIGSLVRLQGVTADSNEGKTVQIRFFDTGKVVARAIVRAGGVFETTAALPARSVRHTNRARYRAYLGKEHSLNLKLFRRMSLSKVNVAGGRVVVRGRISMPLANPIAKIVVKERTDCSKGPIVVATAKPRANGDFTISFRAPKGVPAALYRLQSRVRKYTHNPKTYPTFTLLRGVAVR